MEKGDEKIEIVNDGFVGWLERIGRSKGTIALVSEMDIEKLEIF